uniref:NADH-ubiquinone oxidoreductase chain 4L n=1 Tax=Eusyllis blomstrandi TaxID=199554 RepID=A0A1C9UZC8_EUSBL|nr:NADH dehydrogenase subunit 4L [Eusyllis blomstrandi]AOR87121.1 NADH dehydrogenase subunit 4L [Eusyllis blomstrandi]
MVVLKDMFLSLSMMFPLMIMFSLIALMLTREHLLMCLLNLEMMVLTISISFASSLAHFSMNEVLLILVIFTIGACGASLGLACMVKMTRTYGNDNLNSMTSLKC